MAKQTGIDLDLIDKLLANADKVYERLNQIDAQFEKLSKFSFNTQLTNNFSALNTKLQSLASTLDVIKASGGAVLKNRSKILIETVENLTEALTKLESTTPKDIRDTATNIAEALAILRESISKPIGGGGAKAGPLTKVIGFMEKFNLLGSKGLLSQAGKGKSDSPEKKIQEMVSTLQKLSSIQNISIPNLDLLGVSLTQLFDRIDAVGGKLKKNSKNIEAISKFFNSISRLFESLAQGSGQSDPEAVKAYIGLLDKTLPKLLNAAVETFGRIGEMPFKQWIVGLFKFSLTMGTFVKIIDKLAKVDVKEGVIQAIASIFVSLNKMLDKFILFMTDLKDVPLSTWIKNLVLFRLAISQVTGPIGKVLDKAKGIETEGLKALASMFSGLISTFTIFEKLAKIPWKSIISTVGKMVLFFIPIRIMLGSLINVAKSGSVPQIQAAGALLRAFSQVMNSLTRMVDTFSKINFVKAIAAMIKMRLLFGTMSGALKRLVEMSKGSSPEALKAVAGLMRNFAQVMSSLAVLIKVLKDLSIAKTILVVIKLKVFFSVLGKVLSAMIKNTKGASPDQIEAVGKLMAALGLMVESVAKLVDRANTGFKSLNIKALLFVRLVFGQISKVLKSVIKVTKDADPAKMNAASKLMTSLSKVLDALVKTLKVVPTDVLAKIGKELFKIIEKLFSNLSKAAKKLKPKNIETLSKAMRTFIDFLEVLDKVSKTGSVGLITGVNSLFDALDKLMKRLKQLKVPFGIRRKIGTLQKIGESLGKLVKSLSGKKISSDVIKSFSRLFVSIENLADAPLPDFKDISKGLASIIKVVNKVDGDKVKGLSSLVGALGGGDKSGGLKKTTRETKEFNETLEDTDEVSKQVSKGVLNAYLKILLLRTGFKLVSKAVTTTIKIFKQVNAINLFRKGLSTIKEMGSKIRDLGEKIRDIGERMKDAGSQLISSFGVGKLFQSAAFGAATAFDKIGTQLQVFGGLTADARKQAEAFAFEIGKKYPLSANDALNATLDLIKAGQDLSAVEFILPSAADLAALSDSGSIDQATQTLIAAQSGFSQFTRNVIGDFENISVASDILAAAADVSTASVESIAQGLANVGPSANAFGLTLQETAAILSIFDQNAIRGAEGGTALRSMLNAFGRPATQTALAGLERTVNSMQGFEDVDLALFDEGGGRRNINDLFTNLGRALDALSPEEKAAQMQVLFDTFGRQGALVLLGQGADGIDAVVASMEEVEPASIRAAQMLDNLAGDIVQLKGSGETLMTAFLLPLIDRFARPVVKVLRAITDAFLGLDESVLAFISTAVALIATGATLVGGFLIFLGVLLQVGGGIITLVGFMFNLVGMFALLVGGVIAVVSAMAAILAVFAVVLPVILAVTTVFESLFRVFKDDLGGASTSVSNFFSALGSTLKDVITLVKTVIDTFGILSGFGGGIGSPLEAVGEVIAGFVDRVTAVFTSGIIGKFRRGVQGFTDIFKGFQTSLLLPKRIRDAQNTVINNVARLTALGELDAAQEGVLATTQKLTDNYQQMLTDLASNTGLMRQILGKGATEEDVEQFLSKLGRASTLIVESMTGISSAFGQFGADTRGLGLGEALEKLGVRLNRGFGVMLSGILEGIQALTNIDLQAEIETALSPKGGFGAAIGDIFTRIKNNLKAQAISNRGALKKIFTNVVSFFLSPVKAVGFFGKVFGIEALENFAESFNNVLSSVFGSIFDFVFNLLEGQNLGDAAINAFGEGVAPILTFIEELGRTADLLFTAVKNIFDGFFSQFTDTDVEGNVTNVLSGIFNALTRGLALINEQILEPLSRGDIFGAVSNILPLVFGLLQTLGQSILDVLSTIDVPQIFTTIAASIANLFLTALIGGLEGLADFTGINVTTMLESIGAVIDSNLEAVSSGEEGGVFDVIAGTIVGLFATALQLAFAGIGDALSIDTTQIQESIREKLGAILDTLDDIFLGADGTSIFDNIITIINNLVEAITNIFDTFSGGTGAADDAESSGNKILEFFGKLALISLDALVIPLQALDNFFAVLADLDSDELTQLGISLGVLAVGVKALITIQAAGGIVGVLAKLGTFLGGLTLSSISLAGLLGGALGVLAGGIKLLAAIPIIGPLLGVIAIVTTIQALAQNLDEVMDIFEQLAEFDIGGAIGSLMDALVNVFADITFNLLGLLGIDEIFGQTRDEIVNLARGLVNLLGIIIDNILEKLTTGIKKSIESLGTLVGVDIVTDTSGFDFFGLSKLLKQAAEDNQLNLSDFIDFSGDHGLSEEALQEFVNKTKEALFNTFVEEFSGDTTVTTALREAVKGAVAVGSIDELLAAAFASGDTDLAALILESLDLESLREVGPELAGIIEDAVITGVVGQDLAIELLELLNLEVKELSEAEQQEIRRNVREEILKGLIPFGLIPFDEPVEITPAKVDFVPDDFTEFTMLPPGGDEAIPIEDPIQATGDLELTPSSITIPEGAEIFDETFGLDISDITDPEDIADLAEETSNLVTNLILLQAEFENVLPLTDSTITSLASIDEQLIANRESATVFYETLIFGSTIVVPITLLADLALKASLDSVATSFIGVKDDATKAYATVLTQAVLSSIVLPLLYDKAFLTPFSEWSELLLGITLGYPIFVNTVIAWSTKLNNETSFDRVIEGVDELTAAVLALRDAAVEAGAAMGGVGGVGGGDSDSGGDDGARAIGGRTVPNRMYEILERGASELLQEGGKTFLLSSGHGTITPLSGLPNLSMGARGSVAPAPVPAQRAVATTVNSNINVTQGDIVLGDITADIDRVQLLDEIKTVMAAERDTLLAELNVPGKLRSAHR